MKTVYKITVCKVCGLEAPFECEHMRAMDAGGENVYTSIEVTPKQEDVTERLLNAQAELQTALGFHRLAMAYPDNELGLTNTDPAYIEMRMAACLAMLHSLMGDLGLPMYSPAQMPEGWTPA